jgi:hypothetical protein
MEPRIILAYVLIALLFAALAAGIAFARYNTRDRRIARQRAREAGRRGL